MTAQGRLPIPPRGNRLRPRAPERGSSDAMVCAGCHSWVSP
jgi:hypothetical protein